MSQPLYEIIYYTMTLYMPSLIFIQQKARRSGRFYDVMMMSSGRGLDFFYKKCLLPTHTCRLKGRGDE